jgi:hypothetical protein
VTGDFIVYVKDKEVWNKKGGDGDCNSQTVGTIVDRVRTNLGK